MWVAGGQTAGRRLLIGYLAVMVVAWVVIAGSYVVWDTESFHDLLLGEDQIVDTVQEICYAAAVVVAVVVGIVRRRELHLASQATLGLLSLLALLEKTSYFWLLRDDPPLTVGTKPLDSVHDLNEVVVQQLGTTVFLLLVGLVVLGAALARRAIRAVFARLRALHPGWPYAVFAMAVNAVAVVVDALTPYMTIRGGWLAEYLLKLTGSAAMLAATLAALLVPIACPRPSAGSGERAAQVRDPQRG